MMRPEAKQKADGGAGKRRRPPNLEADLARLEALDAAGLAAAWEDRFGAHPPQALGPRLLRLALAHDLQARTLGGLSSAMERKLDAIAAGGKVTETKRPAPIRLKPGATLVRDWGGRTWRVEVEAQGAFRFEGRQWRSLSAIARAITGTSRNGPAFFGLRGGGNGAE